MSAPLILIEAFPRKTLNGVEQTVRMAGGGGNAPYYYHEGDHYQAGVTALPRIVSALEFAGNDLGTGSVPQAFELRWAPSRAGALAEAAALYWPNAEVTVKIGSEAGAIATTVAGRVVEASVEERALRLVVADRSVDLDKPLLVDRFAGTGGAEGPEDWEGDIKPRAWGRVYNIQGLPIDPASNIYCFGDPTRQWEAIDSVRDMGASASALEFLAWQGSVASTFEALKTASAPVGGAVVCPSIACVKWHTEPEGDLCADIRGENAGGYVETAPEIAQRIVAARGGVAFAQGTVQAAKAARPGACGWYATSEEDSVAATINTILGDVSLLWLMNASAEITIREWRWGASQGSARSHGVSRRRVHKPVTQRRIGYRRNQHVMSSGDIAGIVTATRVVFEDGSTLDNLKPAEPGATNGATPEQLAMIAEGLFAGFRIWTQPTPPSRAESAPGQYWHDSARWGMVFVRTAGNLTANGNYLLINGNRLTATWVLVDETSAQAIENAAFAQASAEAATARADAAIDRLDDLDDDGVLSIGEKVTRLIPDAAVLEKTWSELDWLANALSITTERTAAANARGVWQAYLASLSPAWNNVNAATPIARGALDAALRAYNAALDALDAIIKLKASERAT